MENPSAPPSLVSPSAVKNPAACWPHWDVTEQVIGCAIEVHRHLGPGFLEDAYEEALCVELQERLIPFEGSFRSPFDTKAFSSTDTGLP